MPNPVKLRYYRRPSGGNMPGDTGYFYEAVADIPGSYVAGEELSQEQWMKEAKVARYFNDNSPLYGQTCYEMAKQQFPDLDAGLSTYVTNPQTGNIQLQSSYDKAQRLASDPNMINIGTATAPLYIPKGSPAAQMGVLPINQQTYPEQPLPAQKLSKADELQIALDRIGSGAPGGQDQANIDYAKSKGMLATLYSSSGKKKAVAVGSSAASKLLSQGWTLSEQSDSKTITLSDLKSAEPINISQTGGADYKTVGEANAAIASVASVSSQITDAIKQYQEMLTKPKSDLDTEFKTLLDEYKTDLGEKQSIEEMQAVEEEKKDIKQLTGNLTAVNNKIQTKLAEITALDKQYESEFMTAEGRPVPLASIKGEQAQIYRAYQIQRNALASDATLLQAQAQAAQNLLSDAQNSANKAVNLKYAMQENTLNNQLSMLKLLEGQLSEEEQDYANAVKLALEDQQTAIAEQKNTMSQIQNIALTALSNSGGDTALYNQITVAGSVAGAMQAAGVLAMSEGWKYVSTPAERDNLIKQGYEIMQAGGRTYARLSETAVDTQIIAAGGRQLLINKQTGETIRDLGGAYKASGGGGKAATSTQTKSQWTQTAANKLYQQYIDGGYSQDEAIQRIFGLTGYKVSPPKTETSEDWDYINPETNKTAEQSFLDMGISQDIIDMAKTAGLKPKDLF